MVLTDIVSDIEINKSITLGISGVVTGLVAGYLNFDKKVEDRKGKIFSNNKKIEKEMLISSFSTISGLGAFDLAGSHPTNISEIIIYSFLFRAGYGVGHYIHEKGSVKGYFLPF